MIENQLEKFLDRLYRYCDGFVEIRPLPGTQGYFKPDDVGGIKKYFRRWRNSNIYYGVASRDGRGGKTENLINIPAVWADCDFKDISRKELFSRLNKFLCKPTMIVKSGGGAHFYWVLSEPATTEDFPRIVDVNRRIAARLCGDTNATDAARILRLPTSYNLKYDPPRQVQLTVCDRFEYEIELFLDELPPVETRHSEDSSRVNPPGWLAEALRGVSKGSRNATAAKIAGYFVNKLPLKDIKAILLPWGESCRPAMKKSEIIKVIESVYRYKNKGKPNEQNKFTGYFGR